jgi:hypothetical protein
MDELYISDCFGRNVPAGDAFDQRTKHSPSSRCPLAYVLPYAAGSVTLKGPTSPAYTPRFPLPRRRSTTVDYNQLFSDPEQDAAGGCNFCRAAFVYAERATKPPLTHSSSSKGNFNLIKSKHNHTTNAESKTKSVVVIPAGCRVRKHELHVRRDIYIRTYTQEVLPFQRSSLLMRSDLRWI